MEGKLHAYTSDPRLNLFEYTPRHAQLPSSTPTPPNILLFIGGLYDNFSSPDYLVDLAVLFPRHSAQRWAVMHVQLSSAMIGFGTSSLHKDIAEIGLAIKHIREVIRKGQPTNVVLLGQSTGCQDTLHYLCAANPTDSPRPAVQGAILQAPVSDRDCLMGMRVNVDATSKSLFEKCMALIATVPESEHPTYLLPLYWTRPLFGRCPLSVSRFLDLSSPTSPTNPRVDDLFSHDLPPSRLNATFGAVGPNHVLVPCKTTADHRSMLILISASDEIASKPLTADDLFRLWGHALSTGAVHLHPQSQLIKDATHDISGDTVGQQRAKLVVFRQALLKYIDDVVGGVDELAWKAWEQGVAYVEGLERQESE